MEQTFLTLWAVVATAAAGAAVVALLLQRSRIAEASQSARALLEEKGRLDVRVATLAEIERSSAGTISELKGAVDRHIQLAQESAAQCARSDERRSELESKLSSFQADKIQQHDAFKSLASEALKQCLADFKGERDDAKTGLLEPLRTSIKEFQMKAEAIAIEDKGERGVLKGHIEALATLSRDLQKETASLTLALTSSNKIKGEWGEYVLNRVLETSGLQPEKDYIVQNLIPGDDGARGRKPDVIVKLPQSRSLVIDSKVSLTDYLRYTNAASEDEKMAAAKAHRKAVKLRIKELAGKDYKGLSNLGAPDFVVMFVPNEPAFLLAMEDSDDLWQQAWESHVLLVCPSTLMFALRLIVQLWAEQRRQDNVEAIGKQASKIYSAISKFSDEFAKVVAELKNATDASKKVEGAVLAVISESLKFDDLGVRPDKKLNASVLQKVSKAEPAS